MYIMHELRKSVTMEEYIEKFKEKVQENSNDGQMSEEEKSRELQKILRKLKSGARLTGEDLSFIRHFYPEMYVHVVRIQNQRKQLENQLKSAKSKEEASQIFSQAMTGIAKDDPDKEMLQAAYSKAYSEFQSTSEYKKLPETNQEAKVEKEMKSHRSVYEQDEVEQELKKFLCPEFDING